MVNQTKKQHLHH